MSVVEGELLPNHTHLRFSRMGTVRIRSARAGQLASVMPLLEVKLMVE